jgi:hypothetical protein
MTVFYLQGMQQKDIGRRMGRSNSWVSAQLALFVKDFVSDPESFLDLRNHGKGPDPNWDWVSARRRDLRVALDVWCRSQETKPKLRLMTG